jgi:hypothetical protein
MSQNPWSIQVAAKLNGLVAESKSIFDCLGHNGLRGAAREMFVKDFLLPFLPPYVGIGTGEIINHLGRRSKQIDIVLYNRGRLPPVLIGSGDLGVFPWECVIATIEVKSTLDAGELRSAILNAYSVRRVVQSLEKTSLLVSGKPPLDSRVWHWPIPSYVFAFGSDLTSANTTSETAGHNVGPEGKRYFEQHEQVRHDWLTAEAKLQASDGQDDKVHARLLDELDKYKEDNNSEKHISGTFVGRSDILGVCVLSREWTHGHLCFDDVEVVGGKGDRVRSITKFDDYYQTIFNDGKMRETMGFLGHLLMLAHEMPRCFAHYSMDRYLYG